MATKLRNIFLFIILISVILSGKTNIVSASEGTTYTYTISVDGDYIRTQEAYLASTVYMQRQGLVQPSDLFIYGKEIFIADTGNKRIVVYNKENGVARNITNDAFEGPSGLFVTDERMYIADPIAQAVFICDRQGNILTTISRPKDSPLMSKSAIFKPVNVVATDDSNIIVVGEGSYDGLMQFGDDGEFKGYFAANQRSLTLLERIQEMIYTREQKSQLQTRKPRAIQNIDLSARGLVYSVTQSAEVTYSWSKAETKTSNALKLHNMAGTNSLSPNKFMDDEWNFVDVTAGPYGNVYALTQTGLIYEYDNSGNLLFSFGGRAVSNDRYGLFTSAAAIDLDEEGFVYVLDKERGFVQVFAPTEFAMLNHRAIYDLEKGNYVESKKIWQEILRLNGMSKIAHIGYGKSLLRQQQYAEALEHFKTANDRDNYSECFWEIRNVMINKYIVWVIAGLLIIFVISLIKGAVRLKKKKKQYNTHGIAEIPAKGIGRLKGDFKYMGTMLKHPIDAIYYLKIGKRGSLLSAGIMIIVTFIIYMADILGRGFIFNQNSLSTLSPMLLSAIFFIILGLFIGGNYMVSTINDGEGTIKNIFVSVAYSMVPYMIMAPIAIVLSYVLTQNEAFLITLVWYIGILWSAALVILSILNVHNYTFKQTVKNVLLTLFFAIVALILVAILYLVWDKFIEFIGEVISEVEYRVQI